MLNESSYKLNFDTLLSSNKVKRILDSNLFINWYCSFYKSGCKINLITIHGAVFLTPTKIYSIFLEVHFTTPESQRLTRSILLKGKSVVIIPLIYFANQPEPKFLLVKQRRIFDGEFTLEFPSGRVEEGHTSSYMAKLELFEECGIKINPLNLKILAHSIVVCESSFDESVDWFYCKFHSTDLPIFDTNLSLGIQSEGEFIYPILTTFDSIKNIDSFQIKTGLQLLNEKNII